MIIIILMVLMAFIRKMPWWLLKLLLMNGAYCLLKYEALSLFNWFQIYYRDDSCRDYCTKL